MTQTIRDPETELLGAILLNQLSVSDAAAKLTPADFADQRHQVIFAAMLSLDQERHAIDIVTLSDELQRRGSVQASGGVSYVGSLYESMVLTANIDEYIRLVKEGSNRRALLVISEKIAAAVADHARPDKIIRAAEGKLLALSGNQRDEPVSAAEMLKEALLSAERAQELGHLPGALMTNIPGLDWALGGMMPGDLIVVGARPSMGKTAFGLNIAANVAAQGKSVCFFSLEMGKEKIMRRLLSAEARVFGSKLRGESKLADADWPLLTQASGAIYNWKLWIDDSPAPSPLELRSKIRRHKAKHGCDLVVIDYVGLMRSDDRLENRQVEMASVSGAIKAFTKELHVPVIALSQLSRLLETRGDKRPMMSDLRDTGAWEQDADIVLLLHRPCYFDSDEPERLAECIVGKHRDGATSTVRLAWNDRITRFDEPTALEREEWKKR